MTSITKKAAAALVAVGLMASSLSAQVRVTNFNDGSNQNEIGYYYYFAYTEEVTGMRNDVFSFPTERDSTGTRLEITGAENTRIMQDWPMKFEVFPTQGWQGSPAGGFTLQDIPAQIASALPEALRLLPTQTQAYPAWKFGVQLTANDDIGFNAQHGNRTSGFQHVEKISFIVRTIGVTQFEFALETTNNAPGATPGDYDDPWFVPGRNTNYNVYRVQLQTATTATLPQGVEREDLGGGFFRYTIDVYPVTQPTGEHLTVRCDGGPTTAPNDCPGTGRVGALTQEAWHGLLYAYDPANVTKMTWTFKSQDNIPAHGEEATIIVDDIYLHGANFTFTPHGVCADCAPIGLIGTDADYLLISNFDDHVLLDSVDECIEGEDDENCTGVWWDQRMNMLGHYWYYYTSDGVDIDDGVEVDPEDDNLLVIGLSEGADGNGLFIAFDMTNADGAETPFVGIGTNFFDSERDGTPIGDITGFDASGFEGITFQFKAPQTVQFINVVISDPTDFDRGDDGVRFSLAVRNVNPGNWVRARVKFADMVLPSWLTPDDERYDDAYRPFSQFDLTKLAQIQFRYDGSASTEFAIDDVRFFKAGSTPTRHVASRRAAGAGLRASFNRGVVNVNWNAPSNIESGRIQLIDARGRVVSSAPLTRVSDRRITANLGAQGRVPAGMYFVRVDARDANGRRVVQQAPITIVR